MTVDIKIITKNRHFKNLKMIHTWLYRRVPKLFAKLWQITGSAPARSKIRTLAASASRSPLAYPWYALSKTGSRPRSTNSAASSSHCAGVGSMPA